ncbi:MAG: RNA polymerase factor sigma-54, partial [Acidobacteria bacterium]|nr:RNA polymerase factor sigma-54 [Acidobacteriota bacterium]
MVLQQRLSLKLAQRLVMTPALQQAIKLLQMTRLELEGVLNQEIVENPVLEDGAEEEDTEEGADTEAAERVDGDASADRAEESAKMNGAEEQGVADHPEPADEDAPAMGDIDLDAYFNDYLGPDSTVASTFESRESSPFERNLSRDPDLYDHLLWQLRMSEVSPALREVAELIIGNLDADGFLRASVEEIRLLGAKEGEAEAYRLELSRTREIEEALAASQQDNGGAPSALDDQTQGLEPRSVPVPGYRLEGVERALDLVRGFDPPGVGWHTLQECLLAQLETRGATDGLAYRIVRECWGPFTRRQFRVVARRLRTPLADLEAPVEEIKTLETRPGRQFSNDRTEYVEPDVVALKTGGEWAIQLNDDGLPKLRISRAYRRMLQRMKQDADQAEARDFLKDKMRSAMWLIKSLDQRQRTIYKVAESILRQQRRFFDHGLDELRPMVLRDVADDIGMHESTVSRVVSNKYIHTPRGLFPMKFFFHSGIDRTRGGEISSLTVKRMLSDLIGEEDSRKPMSDSALTRELQQDGINIARRTVAKYRDELGIPSSTDRRRIF